MNISIQVQELKSDESPPSARLVRDLMKVGVPTCSPDTPVPALARLLLEMNFEAVVVLNPEDGHAIGIVSQRELVTAYSREGGRGLTAEDILVEGVPQTPADIPLEAAAQICWIQVCGCCSKFIMPVGSSILRRC